MNEVETVALQAAQEIAPTAPVVEVATAVVNTMANPTPEAIMNDLALAIKLARNFRSKLNGMHPSVIDIIRGLL